MNSSIIASPPRTGRHHYRRRQFTLRGHHPTRQNTSRSKGLLYIGTGVSGGEEGARHGPSIMPGGSPAAWPHVKDIFQTIAAKVEDDVPCCDWVGGERRRPLRQNGPQRHRVRRHAVDLRSLQLMKNGLGMTADEMHQVFAEWNKGELDSLPHRDHPRHPRLQGHRRTTAGGQDSRYRRAERHRQMDRYVFTGTGHPDHADCRGRLCPLLSALKDERVAAAKKLKGPRPKIIRGDRD